MYHLASAWALVPASLIRINLLAPTQHGFAILKCKIYEKEKDHGQTNHDENHHGGEPGFLPAGPGDLLGLAANLLEEFDWADATRRERCVRISRFDRLFLLVSHICLLLLYSIWQERRDSNPRPSVLETDALPTELRSSMLRARCWKPALFVQVPT